MLSPTEVKQICKETVTQKGPNEPLKKEENIHRHHLIETGGAKIVKQIKPARMRKETS